MENPNDTWSEGTKPPGVVSGCLLFFFAVFMGIWNFFVPIQRRKR